MLRRVLVCLDDRSSGRMCLDAALRFAAGYGATLTGLLIRELPAAAPLTGMDTMAPIALSSPTAVALDRLVQEHEAVQDEREERLLHMFREACRGRGLTGNWRVLRGDPGEAIAAAARAYDLVVIGRGDKPDDALGSVASSLVRRLASPVMVVSAEPSGLSTIAVAYDGSHGADRALALAADVGSHWKGDAVAVVLVGISKGEDEVRDALSDAEGYLDTYHLAHRTHVLEGNVAEHIVEVAHREKADLLVMGAYGHSRARELLLGSTTAQVIERWKGAVLLWR